MEMDLTYLGTFGIEDPLRDDIQESVNLIRYGHTERTQELNQVNIRMVTGDHLDTAISVAVQSGIIKTMEQSSEGIALTGEQFREKIGRYTKIYDPDKGQHIIDFDNYQQFDEVKKKIRVIARCTPEDKLVLVCGIQQKGGLVGMTGSSISDAEALKKADVGLCMGSGCDVAKDNSDLIILDNDFVSIHRAISWGRMIFDNVRKFI